VRASRIETALLILLSLAPAGLQAAPPAFLVADLAEGPTALGGPSEAVVIGGVAYFVGGIATTGSEPWRSDGTAAGTSILKDIVPGVEGSDPHSFVERNGELFFATGRGYHLALWKSDGTEAGTQLVKDFGLGDPYESGTQIAVVNGTLFLAAHDAAHGRELWKSDGTPEGTVLVKDIAPGLAGSNPLYLAAHAGLLFFAADDGVHGAELWKSDGTEAGTVLVKDIFPGSESGSPGNFASANGTLVFSANDGVSGFEPWRSDGTEAGTALLKEIEPGDVDSYPAFIHLAGTLYFAAGGFSVPRSIWRTDGTTAGTTPVYTGEPSAGELCVSNGILYFSAQEGSEPAFSLWRTDGTAAGTWRVRDLAAGYDFGLPSELTDVGGTLYFQANVPETGKELWKSDGTEAGTVLVRDIAPGSEDAEPRNLVDLDGTLLFSVGPYGGALWRSDGTGAGTQPVLPAWPNGQSSNPRALSNVDGTLFFATVPDNADYADPLYPFWPFWKTDGAESGTTALSTPGGIGMDPNAPGVAANGRFFFRATTAATGSELGISDGTVAGTQIVADIVPGAGSSNPDRFIALGGTVFFSVTISSQVKLWKTDGTPAGTSQFVVPGVWFVGDAAVMNGVIYLRGSTSSTGYELWRSDGTVAGTTLVKDLRPGSSSSVPTDLTLANGTLFFVTGYDGSLWKSDGTAAGTVFLKSFGVQTGGALRSPQSLVNVNGRLFFALPDYPNASDLWTSDGTPAGTVLVKEMVDGLGQNLDFLTAVGDTLYFTTDDGAHGRELWKSDGTASGTVLVKDIRPGGDSAFPASSWPPTNLPFLVGANGTLFFAANDGVHGEELWTSDGTEAGTQLLADVVPGSGGSSPSNLTVSGPLVYFSAVDDPTGRELYAVPATPHPAVIQIASIATGGTYRITTLSGVSVSIATVRGQSSMTVAANLAAAVSADPTAQGQGIFARAVGASVILVGVDAPNAWSFTDDVGLGGEPPKVSAGGYFVALALAALLALTAWLQLRAARGPSLLS
jgi:ELWxxDGT repeat protein